MRGGYYARMPPRTWLMEVGVGLRASGRPSPSAGKNAGLCPLPRRGGGEGNRARPLSIHSVLKVLASHFPLRTFFCPLTTHHCPPLPQLIHASRPHAILAPVPPHRGRASKAFWCGGGIGRSGQTIPHAAVTAGRCRAPLRRGGNGGGHPLEIIGPGARRDRNIRPSNGVALAHFNANCGRPPWTTAAPLPLDRGEKAKSTAGMKPRWD